MKFKTYKALREEARRNVDEFTITFDLTPWQLLDASCYYAGREIEFEVVEDNTLEECVNAMKTAGVWQQLLTELLTAFPFKTTEGAERHMAGQLLSYLEQWPYDWREEKGNIPEAWTDSADGWSVRNFQFWLMHDTAEWVKTWK